jgi:hypothetical protein
MTERELELRLEAVAAGLDARAPVFDPALLANARPRRVRREVVLLACAVALVAVAAAPAAVSALRAAFEVVEVPTLGPLEPGVAPAFDGRSVPLSVAQASSSFGVRVIPSLGTPDEARVRDDIAGGMVTIVYGSRGILLTQWRSTDVNARISLVPTAGRAEDVDVGGRQALWIEGTARGTFTLTGADGGIHRESFEVSPGALLWRSNGMSYLLQGAGSESDATGLAADLRSP